jgi:hypothetical protein
MGRRSQRLACSQQIRTKEIKVTGPQTFKVLGQPFTVRHLKKIHMKKFGALNGRTRVDRGMVDLASHNVSPHKRAETYLHEFLHAIVSTGGIIRQHDTSEEDLITCLAPLLLHTMRDNPDVIAYLMDAS